MNIRTDPNVESLRLDKAQFFAWAERQDRRYELADGRVVLLPYVKRSHSRISDNIIFALRSRLDAALFDIAHGDFAVETGERSIRYADVMVEPMNDAIQERTTKAALILAEVLSSSTMHVDFGAKLEEYKGLPTLGTYFICAQDEARVWVWTRQDGRWPDAPMILEGVETILELPVIGATVPLAEIYRNMPLR